MSWHFIIGCGFRQNASIESFESALSKLPTIENYSGICVPEDKITHDALRAFAKKMVLPIYGIKTDAITSAATYSQSKKIIEVRHTGSVAEAAALAFFRVPARLVAARAISNDRYAVCAIAKGKNL